MAGNTSPEELDNVYRKRLRERREKFITCIDHVDTVATNLALSGVFTEEEKKSVMSKSTRQHQKEVLFGLLLEKSYANLDSIIDAMDTTLNGAVCVLLKAMRIAIHKETHPGSTAVKTPHPGSNNENGNLAGGISIRELDNVYRKRLEERRDKFIRCLDHVETVVANLVLLGVFTHEEKESVMSKAMRQHQKEALFDLLLEKSIAKIDCITAAMDLRLNGAVSGDIGGESSPRPSGQRLNIRDDSNLGGGAHRSTRRSGGPYLFPDGGPSSPVRLQIDDSDPESVPLQPFSEGDTSFGSGSSTDSGIENSRIQVRDLLETSSHSEVENELESVTSLAELIDLDEESGKTSLHVCLQRPDAVLECMQTLLERYKFLEKEGSKSKSLRPDPIIRSPKHHSNSKSSSIITLNDFVNHKSNDGQTAAHLAAENSLVAIIEELFNTYHCDIFIEDGDGRSALEIMYTTAPEAVGAILDKAIPTILNLPSDGNFKVDIDFKPVIGASPYIMDAGGSKQVANPNYEESALLAVLINQDDAASKIILPHIVVKLFLEFKWKKMQNWFYFSIISQILLHIWYSIFVIHVFLIDCRYEELNVSEVVRNSSGKSDDGEDFRPTSVLNYLFGQWESLEQIFAIDLDDQKQYCKLDSNWTTQAVILFILGIIFVCKEIFELYLKIQMIRKSRKVDKCTSIFSGIKAYLTTLENDFQVVFAALMILVTGLAIRGTFTDVHYSAASISVIVAWGLVLMQLGNVSRLGIYVQILGKVIRSFAMLMCVYIVMIIAFSIAFSIMFPKEEAFKTLPLAISRVLVMMTGEFEYTDTFYEEGKGPPIPLTGHFIFDCFAILLTIILMNLLIGLVVSDVQKLYKFICRKSQPDEHFLDIYVIKPSETDNGMVVRKSINEIPKKLRQPLREFVLKKKSNSGTNSGSRAEGEA